MPSLRTAIPALRRYGFIAFAKRVWNEVNNDNLLTLASAMAYSWLFSIFPFLIFLLSLVPLVMSDDARGTARTTLISYINESVPGEQAAAPIVEIVREVLNDNKTEKVSFLSIGLLITLWTATGGMNMTISALDAAYQATTSRSLVRQRVLALALTLATASMVIMVLVLVPVGSVVLGYLRNYETGWLARLNLGPSWLLFIDISSDFIRYGLSFFLVFSITAIVYHYGPNVKHSFRFFTPGSIFCVAVWILLAMGLRIYLTEFGNYDKTYKTVGGVVILLMVFYLDSLVLLIGAEINGVTDKIIHDQREARA
ncbi:MAG TPA: YihY/virulence factor BrkB family protein [Tepidisphaeraceae bacterium]|nr:YihY/virulence factor BrkB family protein [Tepidisphaeraceae bacterium]